MLTITDGGTLARALQMPIDFRLKRLLTERRDQLGGDITDAARFIVVQPGDSLRKLEQELGFSPFGDDPSFAPEWTQDHGSFYEIVWILTDDGFAHVVLAMKSAGVPTKLVALGAEYVTEKV